MNIAMIISSGVVFTLGIGAFCWFGARREFQEKLTRALDDLIEANKTVYRHRETIMSLNSQVKSLQLTMEKNINNAWRRDKEIFALEKIRHLYQTRSVPLCSKCSRRLKVGTQPARIGDASFQFLCDKCKEKEAQNEAAQTTKI